MSCGALASLVKGPPASCEDRPSEQPKYKFLPISIFQTRTTWRPDACYICMVSISGVGVLKTALQKPPYLPEVRSGDANKPTAQHSCSARSDV